MAGKSRTVGFSWPALMVIMKSDLRPGDLLYGERTEHGDGFRISVDSLTVTKVTPSEAAPEWLRVDGTDPAGDSSWQLVSRPFLVIARPT